MADSVSTLRQRVRRTLNLDPIRGILGDSNGIIYEPNRPGYVRVRLRQGTGFTTYATVRNKATIQMIPGNPVLLYRDPDNELAVYEADLQAQLQSGINPIANNPLDRAAFASKNQTEILTALCYPLSPSSMKVGVKQWPYIIGSTIYLFNGGTIDLTSFVPSSGNHCLVTIFLKTNQTLEAKAATARNILDPLDITDIQQCLTAKTTGSVALWCWRLYGGQTTITIQDSWLDLRQFLNVDQQGSAINLTTPFEINVLNFGANNIGLTWAGETAATFFAAPATVNGKPTFRAIQSSDLPGGSGSTPLPNTAAGRLTLSSSLPLTSSDVTAATTLYYLPYIGEYVTLYSGSGSAWTNYQIPGAGVSASLSGLLADSLYDVYLYDSGGGTLALDLTAWTRPSNGTVTNATNATPIVITTGAAHGLSTDQLVTISAVGGNTAANGTFRITVTGASTFSLQTFTGTNVAGSGAYTSGGVWVRADQANGSRATALATQNGVFCKTGSLTRRYLGTIRITDTIGQCEDSKANRFVWNMNNREARILQKLHLTSHTYTTAAWRFWENDANFRMRFVAGIANGLEYGGTSSIVASIAGTGDVYAGTMIDWVSGSPNAGARNGNTNTIIAAFSTVDAYAEGFHTIPEVEYTTSGTGTFSTGTLYGVVFG